MKCLIKQCQGLGDILFTLKIGIKLCEIYEEVIWPVAPPFLWLHEYLELPDNFNINLTYEDEFIGSKYYHANVTKIMKDDEVHYYPIHGADLNFKNEKIMAAKYKLMDMDFEDWADYLIIKRNFEKEKLLLDEFPDKYNLLNIDYGTPPTGRKIEIFNPNNGFENKFVDMREQFSIFDWMGIIEKAETLHFVDTAFSYIIEKCELKTDKLFLYARPEGSQSWLQTKHLFKKNWKYV